MFTGIIESVGKILQIEQQAKDCRLHIDSNNLSFEQAQLGDSIAVNGVCLTATDFTNQGFWADVSQETLSLSSLGKLKVNSQVNLEQALMPTSRLGGHLVSGHVDGIGYVNKLHSVGTSWYYQFIAPKELMPFIAKKGSITIDGTSLTVNEVNGCHFAVNIVPHTQENTIIGSYRIRQEVNLEVDVVARYLARLLECGGKTTDSSENLQSLLSSSGFIK